ncbi:MAG TPA: AAA family ATPase [Anaerolineales bacterium]|nr:AAA family ATPase [Anaerolineales bacterium]HRF46620.1 AAA family ATPase [Anaerolineales bacterium]
MGRVIAVANQKGGVGKTTTVANLGAALAELGQRVVLIDLDPQGSLTASLGYDPYSLTRTAHLLLTRERVSFGSVLRTVNERLVLVPASVDLALLDVEVSGQDRHAFRLRAAIEGSRVPADFFIIDTPPNLGLLTANALVAARELVLPVQCTYLAMRGVRGLLESVGRIHTRLNAELALLGVLATLYRPGSEHAFEVLQELRAAFPDTLFSTVIEEDDALAQAPAAAQTVLAYRPDSGAAGAFRRLAEEVLHGGKR